MYLEWQAQGDNVMETLDRLFDKGIVIDPWARASTGPIDLAAKDTRLVVASVETYQDRPPPSSGPRV